jgi:glycosyltransferase involved in cell wall biosynthesis
VLIACSGNATDFDFQKHQAFIFDQVEAIKALDTTIEFAYFFIKGKGIKGYLSNLKKLVNSLNNGGFDLIHAHFSLSSLLANLQRKIPVVTTFHGSDINFFTNRILSGFAEILSKKTIYVSNKSFAKGILKIKGKNYIIPCGINLDIFKPYNQKDCREAIGLDQEIFYILFSSSFDNPVKNYDLLKRALLKLKDLKIEVIELKNYTRVEVAQLMNAVDLCVMTSFSEGSPQFIKEAMACNCPVISTEVGDVKYVIQNTNNCYITQYSPIDLSEKIRKVLEKDQRTNGRDLIQRFDNRVIANKVIGVYNDLINGN